MARGGTFARGPVARIGGDEAAKVEADQYAHTKMEALKLHRTNTRRLKREAKAVPPIAPLSALEVFQTRDGEIVTQA